MILRKIKRLQKLVRFQYHLVESIKDIFGWTIFLCISFTVFGCLYSISLFVCYYKKISQEIGQYCDLFGCYGMVLVSKIFDLFKIQQEFIYLFQIFTVIIVMALDKVEHTGKNLSNVAYLASRHITNPEIVEELIFLAKYSKELAPKFVAVCFKVDRYLLSSSLASIVTYLIVVIQFSVSPNNKSTVNVVPVNNNCTALH